MPIDKTPPEMIADLARNQEADRKSAADRHHEERRALAEKYGTDITSENMIELQIRPEPGKICVSSGATSLDDNGRGKPYIAIPTKYALAVADAIYKAMGHEHRCVKCDLDAKAESINRARGFN